MTRTFWLSFVDPDRPEGQRNLGVCIIDIDELDIAAARVTLDKSRFASTYDPDKGPIVWAITAKARDVGCNPGGEVASYEITDADNPAWLARLPRNTLLTKDEAEALNRQLLQ
jgi:hypothetical protein